MLFKAPTLLHKKEEESESLGRSSTLGLAGFTHVPWQHVGDGAWHPLLRILRKYHKIKTCHLHTAKRLKMSASCHRGATLQALHSSRFRGRIWSFHCWIRSPLCTTRSHFWAGRYCDQQKPLNKTKAAKQTNSASLPPPFFPPPLPELAVGAWTVQASCYGFSPGV